MINEKRFNVRLSQSEYDDIVRACETLGWSQSEALRHIFLFIMRGVNNGLSDEVVSLVLMRLRLELMVKDST